MGFTYHKPQDKIYHESNYVDDKVYEEEGSYADSSIVGGFLHLQVGTSSLPSLRSRHNIPTNF